MKDQEQSKPAIIQANNYYTSTRKMVKDFLIGLIVFGLINMLLLLVCLFIFNNIATSTWLPRLGLLVGPMIPRLIIFGLVINFIGIFYFGFYFKNKRRYYIAWGILASLMIVIISLFFYIPTDSTVTSFSLDTTPTNFAKPYGVIKTNSNTQLQSNINTFMEFQVSTNPESGGQTTHYLSCNNILYGYDDKYAYTQVTCNGYIVDDKTNNVLVPKTSFSAPARFEYQSNSFKIINYVERGDGDVNPSLWQIFPQQMYAAYIGSDASNP